MTTKDARGYDNGEILVPYAVDLAFPITCGDEDGNVIDITGYSLRFKASTQNYTVAKITKTTGGSGISLSDPTNGVALITVTDEDFSLPKARYPFSVRRTDADHATQLAHGVIVMDSSADQAT